MLNRLLWEDKELSIEQVSEDLALSSYSSRPVDRYPSDKVPRNIQDLEMVKRNDWMSFQ